MMTVSNLQQIYHDDYNTIIYDVTLQYFMFFFIDIYRIIYMPSQRANTYIRKCIYIYI